MGAKSHVGSVVARPLGLAIDDHIELPSESEREVGTGELAAVVPGDALRPDPALEPEVTAERETPPPAVGLAPSPEQLVARGNSDPVQSPGYRPTEREVVELAEHDEIAIAAADVEVKPDRALFRLTDIGATDEHAEVDLVASIALALGFSRGRNRRRGQRRGGAEQQSQAEASSESFLAHDTRETSSTGSPLQAIAIRRGFFHRTVPLTQGQ
jgi:hypothetical protein